MRTSSGNSTLTSQHVTSNLHRYGERILHCNVSITLGIRETGNTVVLRYVCALLNSGGGILHMKNLDAERCVVLSKHLDTWWSGMEIKMAEILSRDDICNYFDLVGNHDDLDLYLFVKTAEHLCTLQYHCRLPTDTATHDVTYQSLMRLLVNKGEPGTLEQLPIIPQQYVYGQSAEELKKETKQIQFKQLASFENKSKQVNRLPEKVCELMIKYVSAFANHEGGHIYFGIGDTRASVMGEEINQAEQRNLEMLVARRMQTMIWSESSRKTVRGIHWDIKFFHVENTPKKCHRVVVVVSVCKFPGGVFTSCPVSSFVNAANSCVMNFTFEDWKEAILNPLRDVPELHHRFMKLSLMVPLAPLVFSLPDTITTIKQKVILAKSDDLQPRQYLEGYANSKQRDIIRSILSYFKGNNSVCLGMECWGLKIPMNSCDDILCDVAIITELDGIHVLTFSTSNQEQVVLHSQTAALILKNKLVQHGGCSEKFSILSHVVNIDQTDVIFQLEKEMESRSMYPTPFNSNKAKFNKIIQACIVTMAAYRTKSQAVTTLNQNGSYYFLLTHDQFELLWTQQFTKELWVHGPSGAGKTVTAIQLIQELRRRGCCQDNILYLAENNQLCKYVGSHNLCLVTTRRQLLSDVTNPNLMKNQYGSICNVIIDEVQNFKDRDGDWYSVAEKLASQNPLNQLYRCSNYFWLFMDYTQKVHKFQAGLPSVIGKNNFMLSEVSRSTKEIFDFTSRLMMASENIDGIGSPVLQNFHTVPRLAHNFSSGQGVDILSCTEVEIKNVLNKVLTGLLQNGVHENDIAILVGKRSELDRLRPTLRDIHVDESSTTKTDTTEHLGITARSVEEHLSKCDSDKPVQKTINTAGVHSDSDVTLFEDISDDSSDNLESLETDNRYDILSPDSSEENFAVGDDGKASMETVNSISNKTDAKLYSHESVVEDTDLANGHKNLKQATVNDDVSMDLDTGLAIDTVKGFSGLDKIAVIGLNPFVNEEHADFKKYIMSLATRAKDNLVIITTSENIKKQLEDFVHNSS